MDMAGFEKRLYEHADTMKNSVELPFDNTDGESCARELSGSRKVPVYKKIIPLVAVLIIFFMGSTAFSRYMNPGSVSMKDKVYTSLPTEQEFADDVGYAPVLIQEFKNGYRYMTGYVVNNEYSAKDSSMVEEFKSSLFEYEKDGDVVYFSQDRAEFSTNRGAIVDSFTGVELYYKSYMNKIVPENYQMTEAEKEAEAKGDLVFTWGNDSVQTMEVTCLMWIKEDIQYSLTQIDGLLDAEDMCEMAKEAIIH